MAGRELSLVLFLYLEIELTKNFVTRGIRTEGQPSNEINSLRVVHAELLEFFK